MDKITFRLWSSCMCLNICLISTTVCQQVFSGSTKPTVAGESSSLSDTAKTAGIIGAVLTGLAVLGILIVIVNISRHQDFADVSTARRRVFRRTESSPNKRGLETGLGPGESSPAAPAAATKADPHPYAALQTGTEVHTNPYSKLGSGPQPPPGLQSSVGAPQEERKVEPWSYPDTSPLLPEVKLETEEVAPSGMGAAAYPEGGTRNAAGAPSSSTHYYVNRAYEDAEYATPDQVLLSSFQAPAGEHVQGTPSAREEEPVYAHVWKRLGEYVSVRL